MNSCIENKIFHPKNADHYENNLTKPDMEGINMKYTVVIKSVLLGSAMLLHGDTVPPGERSPDKAVMMRNINIAPMFPAHKNEICRDIAKLYEQGIITENAFMMKLNPEGTPPVDPVSEAAAEFSGNARGTPEIRTAPGWGF